MGLVSNLSLTKKLMLITVGISTLTLTITSLVTTIQQGFWFRNSLADHMVTVAAAIGTSNVDAYTEGDLERGRIALSALEAEPSFLQAHLYDASGKQLVFFARWSANRLARTA